MARDKGNGMGSGEGLIFSTSTRLVLFCDQGRYYRYFLCSNDKADSLCMYK